MDPPNFELKSQFSSKDEGDTASSSVSSNISIPLDAGLDSDVVEISPSRPIGTSDNFSSTSAYMLCYRSRAPLTTYPAVPTSILELVEQKNASLAEDAKRLGFLYSLVYF